MDSTNLGPLPTDFSLSPECESKINELYLIWTPGVGTFYLQGPVNQSPCYPSSYAVTTQSQYYSPGTACPAGFTAPCQSLNVAGTVTETVLTCCQVLQTFACQTSANMQWESEFGCVSGFQGPSTETIISIVSDGVTTRTTTIVPRPNGLNAFSVQVRYQSTDIFPSATPSATSDTLSSLSLPTEPGTPTPTLNPSPRAHELSSRAIAGIAIGVSAAAIVGAILLWLVIRMRRRVRKQTTRINPSGQFESINQYQESHHNDIQENRPIEPQETDERRRTAELDARRPAAELENTEILAAEKIKRK
ncbi:hypothetical protein F4777DRAFT_558247 [Nemania sp. FL0916]|nr:hypothetical protein F4777DRAFT_558247 [Nemania sp. FL0916]